MALYRHPPGSPAPMLYSHTPLKRREFIPARGFVLLHLLTSEGLAWWVTKGLPWENPTPGVLPGVVTPTPARGELCVYSPAHSIPTPTRRPKQALSTTEFLAFITKMGMITSIQMKKFAHTVYMKNSKYKNQPTHGLCLLKKSTTPALCHGLSLASRRRGNTARSSGGCRGSSGDHTNRVLVAAQGLAWLGRSALPLSCAGRLWPAEKPNPTALLTDLGNRRGQTQSLRDLHKLVWGIKKKKMPVW